MVAAPIRINWSLPQLIAEWLTFVEAFTLLIGGF